VSSARPPGIRATGHTWPRHLRSRRLLLRAVSPNDPASAWLPEAEIAVRGGGEACPLPRPTQPEDSDARGPGTQAHNQNEIAYWLRPAGQPSGQPGKAQPAAHDAIGACAARIDDGDLVWTWLAVGAEWRALGLGGAAVPIVERAALRLHGRRGRVLVPANNGIGLYFWLRLGYRPDPAAAWPKPVEGTWMLRDLSDRDRRPRTR